MQLAKFEAKFFNGNSSKPTKTNIEIIENEYLKFTVGSKLYRFNLNDVQLNTLIARNSKRIYLLNNSFLELSSECNVEIYFKSSNFVSNIIHKIENNLLLICLVFLLSIFTLFIINYYVIPTTAKTITNSISEEAYLKIQARTSNKYLLDSLFPYKSEISSSRKNEIKKYFLMHCSIVKNCPNYTLIFKKGGPKIGPNAFTLPDGQIIFTDELINISTNDNELVSIFSHELGHLRYRHWLRQSLQETVFGILIVSLTGEIETIISGVLTGIIGNIYSKDMELEADKYAKKFMETTCIGTHHFNAILTKLNPKDIDERYSFFSTHPQLNKRIMGQSTNCI